MKLNLNNNVKFHNKYELEVIDAATGQKKQTAIAENVVTTGIWNILKQSSPKMYGKIALGTGTGTPSAADTALFNQSFAYAGTFTMLNLTEQWPTCSYTVKVSIPATTSYVGTFTEIGLYGSYYSGNTYYTLWSHAMLKDAEGNQITITKTDLDILTITATIYVTFSHTDNNFIWMTPGAQNIICNVFRNIGGGIAPFTSGKTLQYCSSVLLDEDTGTILQVTATQRLGSSAQMNESRVVNIPSVRMGTGTGNDTFYNAVLLGYTNGDSSLYFGGIVFPNTSIFPNQVLAGMNIGVGDGTTKEYTISLPHFLENTDVIYVDGVKKTRGVDYTLDNTHATIASASDLSEFLVPVSGLELSTEDIPAIPYTPSYNSSHAMFNDYWAGSNDTTARPLFTLYNATSKQALLKSHIPFVYKAPSNCLSSRLNDVQLFKFGVSGGGGSDNYCKFNRPLMVYEARESSTLKLVQVADGSRPTTAELQAIVAAQKADPQLHPTFIGAGTLVRCVTVYEYYRRYMKVYDDECFVCALHKNGTDSEEHPTVRYYILSISTTQNGAQLTGQLANNGSFTYEGTTYYYYLYLTDAVSGTVDTTEHLLLAENAPPGWTVALGNYDTAVYGICYDGCKILISGSNDQRTWNQIHSIPIVGRMDVKQDDGYVQNVKQYDAMSSHSDNTQSYTYYKVELDISGATSLALKYTPAVALATGRAKDDTVAIASLSYSGANLVFTEPPAEGAVIKMDATIDRPYKNANFVIDAAMTLSFGGA